MPVIEKILDEDTPIQPGTAIETSRNGWSRVAEATWSGGQLYLQYTNGSAGYLQRGEVVTFHNEYVKEA